MAVVAKMFWEEFVWKFDRQFTLDNEVQLLVREFQDLQHTTYTVVEITTKFRERALVVPQ